MADEKVSKFTQTSEVPVEVPMAAIAFLNSCRESATALLTRHLDNEAARLRVREMELQRDLREEEASRSKPRSV